MASERIDLASAHLRGSGQRLCCRSAGDDTLDAHPAKAALYHLTIVKPDLFAGGPAEHGRWISFADAGNHATDRAAEREALLSRVFDAAVAAMGESAPAKGSSDAERMRKMLKAAVEANRSDRLVVFDIDQRSVIEEVLDEARFELRGHESDEDLCDLILAAHPRDLFDNMEEDFEIGLLKAFASDSAVVAIEGTIEQSPLAAGPCSSRFTGASNAMAWTAPLPSISPSPRAKPLQRRAAEPKEHPP